MRYRELMTEAERPGLGSRIATAFKRLVPGSTGKMAAGRMKTSADVKTMLKAFYDWMGKAGLTFGAPNLVLKGQKDAGSSLTGQKIMKNWGKTPNMAAAMKEVGIGNDDSTVSKQQLQNLVQTVADMMHRAPTDEPAADEKPQDQAAAATKPAADKTPAATTSAKNVTPTDFASLMSYISTKMDPNQAQLMLKQIGGTVAESYLAERGEFKTAKLVAVYKTLKPKQQARIKQVLASRVKKQPAAPAPTAQPAPADQTATQAQPEAPTPSAPPAEPKQAPSKVKVGQYEYYDTGDSFVDVEDPKKIYPKTGDIGKGIIDQIKKDPNLKAPMPSSYVKAESLEMQLRKRFRQL